MNGISHKQAIRLIHRRLDGLLKGSQQSMLDEHLHSCDACHTYAEEMDGLSMRLNHEFQARWDRDTGPSPKVMEHITASARGIPMAKRLSSNLRVLGGITALLILGFVINFFVSQLQNSSPVTTATEPALNTPLIGRRLLAFTSSQNGNSDIFTMHADGSELTNLTNHPGHDAYPFWSPDGKQIAFMSDRDGSVQIYLMDADGSNVIQLTQGEGNHLLDVNGYTPWSPDGRKLIYSYKPPEEVNWRLYVMDIDEDTSTTLTDESGVYILPSWSPNGKHIAFISAPSDRTFQQIFVVDEHGNNLTHLTDTLTTSEVFVFGDYSWSQDGMSITFSTHSFGQGGQSSAYEADLDGSLTVLARTDKLMVDWWNGTALHHDPDGKMLTWLHSNSLQATLNLCQSDDQFLGISFKRSKDGNLAFGSNCSGRGWMLYWANPDGTMTDQLLNSPVSAEEEHLFHITWSPDDRYLAFVSSNIASPTVTNTLYVLDVVKAREDPSIQPLKMTNSSGPSWQPGVEENLVDDISTSEPPDISAPGNLIAFTSDQNGNLDIYTVHSDGSDVTNLTNDAANDHSPAWSPDGSRLAFVSDRDGNDNIYVMNADGSELTRMTDDPGSDISPLWSPDGRRIAYTAGDPDEKTANLYVMDSNGDKRRRLTDRRPNPDSVWIWADGWSLDGEYIFYIDQQGIVKVNTESGELTTITPQIDSPSYLAVSKEDSKVIYLHSCSAGEFCSTSKTIGENGTGEETRKTMQLQRVCTSGDAPLNKVNDFYYMAKWSPDRTRIIFAFNCLEYGGLFYIANADGSDFKSLTSYPVLYQDTAFDWSPDGQSIIFTSALEDTQTQDLYILSVKDALQNPELHPTALNISVSQISSLAWQPIP